MKVRSIVSHKGELFAYMRGDQLFTLEGELSGRIDGDYMVDLAGRKIWRLRGDGIYALDGFEPFGYMSEPRIENEFLD